MNNCGCIYCKRGKIPTTHSQWKSLKNKHGRTYGMHVKGGRAPKSSKNILKQY